MNLRVMTWNICRSNTILDEIYGADRKWDVIALQEPPWRPGDEALGIPPGIRCPTSSGYKLIQPEGGAFTRAILLVKADRLITAHEAQEDWCSVEIQLGNQKTTFLSIYSPSPGGTNWRTPLTELRRRAAAPRTLAMGDFNLHHPMWMPGSRPHPQAERLIGWTADWSLELLTPPAAGTFTNPRGEDTTIDLIWGTGNLDLEYRGRPRNRGGDHYPQEALLRTGYWEPETRTGLNWKLTDQEMLKPGARTLPWPRTQLDTTENLDDYVRELTAALLTLADEATPKRKGGPPRVDWWSAEVKNAIRRHRVLYDQWKRTGTPEARERLADATRERKKTIDQAKRKAWRQAFRKAEEAEDAAILWRTAKWARTRSSRPVGPPTVPTLRDGDRLIAETFEEKVEIFQQKFFPQPTADLSDIADTEFTEASFHDPLDIPQRFSSDLLEGCLRNSANWKAPGPDTIPNGFLKMLGEEFLKRFQKIADASASLAYFPRAFRGARTVVIPKPKPRLDTVNAWRPISLLNTMGKILESAMARMIADAAEENRLLPEEQMGNRRNRNTDTAIQWIVDQALTARSAGGVTSILSMDIIGAFDKVDHMRLLDVLRKKGFPRWIVHWVKTLLDGRTAQLSFDGKTSADLPIAAGVPQGSPLSPILFILYTSSFYELLGKEEGITTMGFADDSTLLSHGATVHDTLANLRRAYHACEKWAKRFGVKFDPSKFQLLHCAGRTFHSKSIRLNGHRVPATRAITVLGVKIDHQLNWMEHIEHIKGKMENQKRAITKIMASTWGPSLRSARVAYTAIVRAAVGHGAPAWHTPTKGIGESHPRRREKC